MKKFYQKLIRMNNSVAGAASGFGRGAAGKNHPVQKVEIPDSIFKRELEEHRKELLEQRKAAEE